MNLAYIIVAYTDEKNLRRLIGSLHPNADFYIHIDSKVDISPFIEELSGFDNVTFCPNRYFTNWGSFAQVLSQKELLRCVIESNKNYDRVISLSGTDYPIWSNKLMTEELERNKDKQYLIGVIINRDSMQHLKDQVIVYHFFRDIRLRRVSLKKMFSGSARLLMKTLPLRKKTKVVINSKLVDVYKGADLWNLTFDCAKYVYEVMCTEKKMMQYFKTAFAPSEFVTHTIVFNSKFADTATNYVDSFDGDLLRLMALHLIHYRDFVKVYTEPDYNTIIDSGKMFFRKSATGKSDKLLDKIDLYRNK
jgi:hypothetical protein